MSESAFDLGATDRFEPTHVFLVPAGWSWGMDDDGNYFSGDARGWVDVDEDEVDADAVTELQRLAEVAS